MDELAVACRIDPVELRLPERARRAPGDRPAVLQPPPDRLACGKARLGSAGPAATPAPGVRREGRWLTGTGVAASTYPAPGDAVAGAGDRDAVRALPGTDRRGRHRDRRREPRLLAVAVEALGVPAGQRSTCTSATSALPPAMIAGGSMGTASWDPGAVIKACRAPCATRCGPGTGPCRRGGLSAPRRPPRRTSARWASQQLAGPRQVRLRRPVRRGAGGRRHTGEVRVPRLLGVFAAGRPHRHPPRRPGSQLIGGMTMGLSMALHEESAMDPQFGDYPQPRPGRVPHRGRTLTCRTSTRCGSTRRSRTSGPPGGQGDRRGGHRGHGRRHRQRGVPRQPGSGSATCRSGSTSC